MMNGPGGPCVGDLTILDGLPDHDVLAGFVDPSPDAFLDGLDADFAMARWCTEEGRG